MAATTQPKSIAALQAEAQETLRSKTALQKALHRLRSDHLTLLSLAVIAVLSILCFSSPLWVESVLDINYNDPDLYNSFLPVGSVVVDSDSTTWTWDAATGESIRAFIGHTQPVTSATFSTTDSNIYVTGSTDGEARLWHIPTGRSQRRVVGHLQPINDVALSLDNAWIATASDDGTVGIWDREKDDPNLPDVAILTLEHDGAVNSVTYSTDGTQILTGSADGTAVLWDAESGEMVLTFEVSSDVNETAISADGALVATASDDGVQLWDVVSGESLLTLAGHDGSVLSVAFSPDGTQLVSGGADLTVRLWDVESGEIQNTLEGHAAAVNSVAFTPDGMQILSGSADTTARLWDVASGETNSVLDDEPFAINAATISPDGETIVTGMAGRERTYVLGTDSSGRDHLSRLMQGGIVSLQIGFFAAIGALTIGIFIGVIAGYFGGIIDDFIIWVITTLNSIPSLFLLLIISALLAPNSTSLILVLALLGWTGAARLVRGETFAIRERDFVVAARSMGASDFRIMFLHIVPNVVSLLLIVLTRGIGGLILAESGLSFLGFGVKPPEPTWGNMLSGGLELLREAPHLVFAPGLLITVTVLCLYVIGDGLRDAFDPKISD